MTPEQNTTNDAKVAIPTKEERDMDQRWLAANIFPAESHLRAVREVIEKYIAALEHVEADRDEWKERAVNEHAGKANAEIERDTLRSQLAEMTKANEGLRGQVEVGDQIIGSFFEALKPLNLPAIYVANPGRHITELIAELTTLKTELAAAKQQTAGITRANEPSSARSHCD